MKRVSLAEANEYLRWRETAAVRIAAATFLCIVAIIPLLLLIALNERYLFLSENAVAGAGLISLLVLITAAVAMFLSCGFRNTSFDFLDNASFETEYGVAGMVRERQKAYQSTYVLYNMIGTCTCILSLLPLFIGIFRDDEIFFLVMLCVTLLFVGFGVVMLVLAGVRCASMQRLLQEGDFTLRGKQIDRLKNLIATVYWLTATSIYLIWSFWTNAWERSWLVWPVAGVLFGALMCLCDFLLARKSEE